MELSIVAIVASATRIAASATPEQRAEMVALLYGKARESLLYGMTTPAGMKEMAAAHRTVKSATATRFSEPEEVQEWVDDHWDSHLADPETREEFLSGKECRLTTQDKKNLFHWVCGADENLRRSYKNTARCTSMAAVVSEICDRLTGYGTPKWKRGDRYTKMRGPRSVSSGSGSDDDA